MTALVLDSNTPCAVNTHGYVEADWTYASTYPDTAEKKKLFRQNMTVREAVELLAFLIDEGDESALAHEIIIEPENITTMSFIS